MKLTWDSALADLLFHLVIAILGGGLAFRACLYGIGFGSAPNFAIAAGVATGMLTFILPLAMSDLVDERRQRMLQLAMVGLLVVVHLIAFGLH